MRECVIIGGLSTGDVDLRKLGRWGRRIASQMGPAMHAAYAARDEQEVARGARHDGGFGVEMGGAVAAVGSPTMLLLGESMGRRVGRKTAERGEEVE